MPVRDTGDLSECPGDVSPTTLTEAHLGRMEAADKPSSPGQAGLPYTSMRSSVVDSALTLAASHSGSPLPSPLAEKEHAVSPLDRAGSLLESQNKSPEKRHRAFFSAICRPASSNMASASAWAAWSQVAAAFLLNAIAWGTLSMFGVYQLYYTQTLGLPNGTVSWVGSLQTFLTYLVSTVSGQLADAGHAVPTALVGTLLVVAGGVWTSFAAHSLPQLFVAQAVCTGIGLGLLSAPPLPSITAYFGPGTPRASSRALALAVSTIGTSVGGAVLPAVVQYLLPAAGFAWAIRCAALVALIACVGATLLIRPLPARKAEQAKEAEHVSSPTSPSAIPSASPCSRSSFASHFSQLADWDSLREGPFVLFLVSTFFMYWGLYFGFNYINVYAEKVIGLSANQATVLLILSAAMGIPSRAASGVLAGYCIGALDSLVLTSLMMAVTIFCWLAVGTSTAGMYVFVIFFGLANGGTQGVWLGSIADLMPTPTTDHVSENTFSSSADASADSTAPAAASATSRIGARFGMACTVAAFATLAGPPTAAALIAQTGTGYVAADYHGAIIWSGAVTLASVVITAFARVRAVGWRPRASITENTGAASSPA